MNCFQICIFVLIATTFVSSVSQERRLWIAFKFVSLYWLQQHTFIVRSTAVSCELLSNLYLCTDCNNSYGVASLKVGVVNCFQICIFVLIATTIFHTCNLMGVLWIAFKFVSLYWLQQLLRPCFCAAGCCELLSNLYLCTDCNNSRFSSSVKSKLWIAFKFVSLYWLQQQQLCVVYGLRVVNCFQICIFVLIATTSLICLMLW